MGFLKGIFNSKKAAFTLVGIVTGALTALGLNPDVAELIVKVVMAYLASQGVVDLGLALKGTKKG